MEHINDNILEQVKDQRPKSQNQLIYAWCALACMSSVLGE